MISKNAILALSIGVALALGAVGCKPKYPSCKKDAHCRPGEYCVNNSCQQCRDNGDCPAGQECAGGACRQIPGYCSGPADCGAGQICRDQRCGPCLAASDCDSGKVCLDGVCSTAECHTTNDCPAGLSCIDYKCKVDENAMSGLGAGDCKLEPLYFDFDSSEVTPEQRSVLERNYDCLVKRGGKLVLEGHCDNLGTTEYNMALGERRAGIVKKLLTALGFDGKSARVISKGEEEATGVGEDGRAKDRRVDFE
jgi:peptidoglycan-associated lipoprotein